MKFYLWDKLFYMNENVKGIKQTEFQEIHNFEEKIRKDDESIKLSMMIIYEK